MRTLPAANDDHELFGILPPKYSPMETQSMMKLKTRPLFVSPIYGVKTRKLLFAPASSKITEITVLIRAQDQDV